MTAQRSMSFVARRVHSLAGLIPLGIFLVEHLITNASVLYGRARFDANVAWIQQMPALRWLELVGIALPLTYHALYGIFVASRAQPNVGRYPHGANWLFLLQRITGLLTFAFVILHLAHFRFAKARGVLDSARFYPAIEALLSTPAYYALYLLGVTSTVFHFANGLRTACETWGLSTTARTRRVVAIVSAGVGVLLWVIAVNTLFHFVLRCGGVLPLPGQHRALFCGE
jgi:succinate dehydrogenase / fumarate reductase cytochrome b subunit